MLHIEIFGLKVHCSHAVFISSNTCIIDILVFSNLVRWMPYAKALSRAAEPSIRKTIFYRYDNSRYDNSPFTVLASIKLARWD
jgi:hypothetical protein